MCAEFKSELDELFNVKELDFEQLPVFGRYREFFPEEARAHPAKAYTDVIEYLVKTYTLPGEIVLDPMAGTGSTCVVATLHGRHCIAVDIEERFYKWMLEAKKRVENYEADKPKGRMVVIKGDARRLSVLLEEHRGEIDSIITSPPYANGFRHNPQDPLKRIKKLIEVEKKAVEEGKKWNVSSMGAIIRQYMRQDMGYGAGKDNIGNLVYGNIDAIITSPPYSETLTDRRKGYTKIESLEYTRQYHTNNPLNIGNLKHGRIDAIITSPPYAHESTASKPTRLECEGMFRMGHSKEVKYTEEDYRKWDKRTAGNIAKLKMFVRIPCSPEEAEYHDKRPGRKGTKWEYTKEVMVTIDNLEEIQGRKDPRKGRTETYVEAMLKVYRECYKVLKPGGKIIVIIKPFIRKKKVVDLPYHTHLLLEHAGFKTVEVLKYRLKKQSFWRKLYYKKYPEVPRIEHEYIIIAVKQKNSG